MKIRTRRHWTVCFGTICTFNSEVLLHPGPQFTLSIPFALLDMVTNFQVRDGGRVWRLKHQNPRELGKRRKRSRGKRIGVIMKEAVTMQGWWRKTMKWYASS